MGFGTFVHHIGTLLLLVATVLLIVVDVTAPVVNRLSMMTVELGPRVPGTELTFGTFGYCHRGIMDTDQCSRTRIGYNPAELVSNVTGTDFSSASENTSKALTRVMVLHPVATGLCFIAFLLCLGTSVVGSILTALFSLLSFVVTVIAMVCDFVAFSIIRQEVNGDEDVDALARWGSGIWLMLAAAVFTLVGALVVLVTCCASRAKKRRSAAHSKESAPEAPPPAARRRFWQRGARL